MRSARSGRVMTSSIPLRITGPDAVEQHFVLVGIERPGREAAARGQPAQRVGNPGWQA